MEAVEATHIELEFKGGEKASFIRWYHDSEGNLHSQKCKTSKTFLHEKQKVFPIVDGML